MLAYWTRYFSLMGGLRRLDVVISGALMWSILFWRCKVMRACDAMMRRPKTSGYLLPAPGQNLTRGRNRARA